MVYFGKVQNGKIVPEAGARLTEGTTVRIEPVETAGAAPARPGMDPFDSLGDDAVDTGITDMAAEHDHYAYGTPKRSARKDK